MMQGSSAWNWSTYMQRCHLMSAMHSSIISWLSHSRMSSIAALLFSLCLTLPSSLRWMVQLIEEPYFCDTWQPVRDCIYKAEPLWLRERDIPLTCSKNTSRRMGDKGVLEGGCQQKWISAGEDTTHAVVHWFTTSWQLFTVTAFEKTASCDFISEIMHLSKPAKSNWDKIVCSGHVSPEVVVSHSSVFHNYYHNSLCIVFKFPAPTNILTK